MIYFDNAATTIIDPLVKKKLVVSLDDLVGNPSSKHGLGLKTKSIIKKSRKIVADYLNVDEEEIIFTSSATESNNIAIFNTYELYKNMHIITTKIEHSSLLLPIEKLKENGVQVSYIKLNIDGKIDIENLKSLIQDNTRLVAISMVNNEIGTIQDVETIGAILKNINPDILFLVDGVQAIGHLKIDIRNSKIDYFSFSGHKIYAPKGIGVLYKNKEIILKRTIFGGNQENGLRSGTENVLGIFCIGEAINKLKNENYEKFFKEIKQYLIKKLKMAFDDIIINSSENCASHIISITFSNIPSSYIVASLSIKDIYISSSSACNEKQNNYSYVIEHLFSKEAAYNTIRISFGFYNTFEECDLFVSALKDVIHNYTLLHD